MTGIMYKNEEKNIRFCESVHTDPHKNATKTEVFESAIKGGYQKRMFLKTLWINVNAQKRRFLKTLQYSTMGFTKTEQCERTKTDVFRCVFVIGQISVNAQKRRLFSQQCEWGLRYAHAMLKICLGSCHKE